jgi:hypothetical protein
MISALIACLCAGCAESSTQRANRIEPLLSQAGFIAVSANTPARVAKLSQLKPLKVKESTHNGEPVYWFADPYVCHCVFRGTRQEYQQYQALSKQQELAEAMDNYQMQQAYETYMGGAANQVFYGQ